MAVEGDQSRFVHTKLHPKTAFFVFFSAHFVVRNLVGIKKEAALKLRVFMPFVCTTTERRHIHINAGFSVGFFSMKVFNFKDTKTNQNDKQRHS